jgi:hypothetical protein
MDARFLRAALLVGVGLSLGAGRPYYTVRSQHFLVSAPTQQLATEICQAAEKGRRDLAIEWLGRELPPWQGPCPIQADVAPQLGAGGATSFVFRGGVPTEWTMRIQGSRERILDSVLPHELTHTVFATHFGRPLPRWADEGACTTVEHASEKAKQDKFLIEFLTTDRGIPFNDMFRMKDYPADILPLYSQGYSLARFFIEQGGKHKFVEYVGQGMRTNNWTQTTAAFYGFNSLSDLQTSWVDWVRKGSPPMAEPSSPDGQLVANGASSAERGPRQMSQTQLASLTQQPQSRMAGGALASWQTTQSQNARAFTRGEEYQPPQPASYAAMPATVPATVPASGAATAQGISSPDYSSVSRPVSDGWYARRRDQTQAAVASPREPRPSGSAGSRPAPAAAAEGTHSATLENVPGTSPAALHRPARRQPIQALPMTPVARAPAEVSRAEQSALQGFQSNAPSAYGSQATAGNDRRVLLEWKRPSDQPYRGTTSHADIALK